MAEDIRTGEEMLDAAAERGRIEAEAKPRAVSARYDRQADRIVIDLANGCTFLFPPGIAQDLQDATPDQLAEIEVSPIGFALHWPQIDVDFSVAGLVAGTFGTAAFMDAQRRGGRPRSAAEAAAGRANGRTGDHPRRSA